MKLSINQIVSTNLFKENNSAALRNPGNRTEHQCISDAMVGSGAEIAAIALLGKDKLIKNTHPDMRMVYAYDLQDNYYRYEVKSIEAGEYATFHTKEGQYSKNGAAGFSLSSALRYNKADWILVMKYEYIDTGNPLTTCFVYSPHVMVWLPSMHNYVVKSKRPNGGFYFDHKSGTVEDEFLVGKDIEKFLQKLQKSIVL